MQVTPAFSLDVRVYYEDTDTGGIVYYANYLRYFERARTEWLRSLGINQQALASKDGVQFVVRRATLDFVAAARLDDLLSISVQLKHFARTYVELAQQAVCAGRMLCSGEVTIACVQRSDMRPVAIPGEIAALMKR